MEAWRYVKVIILLNAVISITPTLLSLVLPINIHTFTQTMPGVDSQIKEVVESMVQTLNSGSVLSLFALPISIFLLIVLFTKNVLLNLLSGNYWLFQIMDVPTVFWVPWEILNLVSLVSFIFFVITGRNVEL